MRVLRKRIEIKQSIALQFKNHRKYLGLTQYEVGELLDLQRTSITNMESANQTISAHDWEWFGSLTKEDIELINQEKV